MNRRVVGALAIALMVSGAAFAEGNSERNADQRGRGGYRDRGVEIDERSSEPGILVTSVIDDSPAAAAGLIRGDVILEVEGSETDTIAELREVLSELEAGDTVRALVLRGGEEMTVEVTLETRLYRPAFGIESGRTGRRMPAPGLTPRFAPGARVPDGMQFRFSEEDFPGGEIPGGDVVHSVQEGSPAETAGIQPGDIIVSVNGAELDDESIGELIAELAPGETIELGILRLTSDGGVEEITVSGTLAANDDEGAFLGITYHPFRFGGIRDRVPMEGRRPLQGRTPVPGTTDL